MTTTMGASVAPNLLQCIRNNQNPSDWYTQMVNYTLVNPNIRSFLNVLWFERRFDSISTVDCTDINHVFFFILSQFLQPHQRKVCLELSERRLQRGALNLRYFRTVTGEQILDYVNDEASENYDIWDYILPTDLAVYAYLESLPQVSNFLNIPNYELFDRPPNSAESMVLVLEAPNKKYLVFSVFVFEELMYISSKSIPILEYDFLVLRSRPDVLLPQSGSLEPASLPFDTISTYNQIVNQSDAESNASTDTTSTVSDNENNEKLDSLVKQSLKLIMEIGKENSKDLTTKAEALLYAAMSFSSKDYWTRLILGLGAIYGFSVNESVMGKLSSIVLPLLFGSSDVKSAAIHVEGVRDNLRKSRMYELLSFILLPFNTDIDLSLGDLKLLHVECAKRIDGLDLLQAIIAGSQYISEGSRVLASERNLTGFSISDSKVLDFTKSYAVVQSKYIDHINSPGASFDYDKGVQEADVLLAELKILIQRMRSPIILKSLTSMLYSLTTIRSTYQAKSYSGKLVPACFAFSIFGASQIGKSALMTYSMTHLAKIHNEKPDTICARGDEKFLEHVSNDTKYLVLDDVANVHPDFAERSPLDLFLRLKNNISTPIDQAAADRKGKICPVLTALGITTNISDFNAGKYSIMTSSLVLRCNIHVTLSLLPEFKNKAGTLDQKAVQDTFPCLDGSTPITDIWSITVYTVVMMQPATIKYRSDFIINDCASDTPWMMEVMTYEFPDGRVIELKDISVLLYLEFLGHYASAYRDRQLKFVNDTNTTNYEREFCYGCCNSQHYCACIKDTVSQAGLLSKQKTWLSTKLCTLIDNTIEGKIDDEIRDLDHGFGSIFGFEINRHKLYKRIQYLFLLCMDVLASSKLLHVLTLLPDDTYERVDTKTVIYAIETDRIVKTGVLAVIDDLVSVLYQLFVSVHFGISGLFFGFLSTVFSFNMASRVHMPKIDKRYGGFAILANSFLRSLLISVYILLVILSILNFNYKILWYGFIGTIQQSEKSLVIVPDPGPSTWAQSLSLYSMGDYQQYVRPVCVLSEAPPRPPRFEFPTLDVPDFPDEYLNNTYFFALLVGLLTFALFYLNRFYYTYIYSVDDYICSVQKKIVIARKLIEPYRAMISEMCLPNTEAQSGPSESYIRDWTTMNKEQFEPSLRSKDEIEYPIKHNLLILDDGKENCMGLMLRSGQMLIPLHYVGDLERPVTAIRYDNPFVGNRKFSLVLSKEMCVQVGDKDLAILNFASNTFSDITNLFPDFNHLEPPSGVRYHKDKNGKLVKVDCTSHTTTVITTKVWNPISRVWIRNADGFQYTAPNGAGLCGSPVISGSKKTYIKGIHIAGSISDSTASYAIRVRRCDILTAMEQRPYLSTPLQLSSAKDSPFPIDASKDVPVQSPALYVGPDKQFTFLGRVGGYTTMKNQVFNHSISAELHKKYPNKWGSPLPLPGEKKYVATDSWMKEVTTQNTPVRPALLIRAREDWKEPLLPLAAQSIKLRVLNRKEIVNGCPGEVFLNPIDMSTSPGFSKQGKKCDWATQDEYGSWIVKEEIWNEVRDIEKIILGGKLPVVPSIISGKMEVRKIGKGMRHFANVPFCLLLVVRKYFGSVFSFLVDNWKLSECAIGINPYSSQWHALKMHLDQGALSSWHAEDVSSFDQNILPDVLQFYGTAIIDLAEKGNYSPQDLTIMRGLITTITNPSVVVNGDLLQLFGLMLSGVFGTTHFDSGIISLLHRAHFFEVYGLNPALKYRDYCRLMCFGDDSIENTKGLWKYNSISYAKFCKEHNIKVTDSHKQPVSTTATKFAEVSFLKRGFRWCSRRKEFVAPIELDSIFKSLHCYVESKHVEPDDVLRINIDRAVAELSMHPEDVYNEHIKMISSCSNPVVPTVPALSLTYTQAIDRLVDSTMKPMDYQYALRAESGELDSKGPVSKIASNVAEVTSAFSEVPIIGDTMLATSIVAKTVAGIAEHFGFSKPHQIQEESVAITSVGSLAPGNINDTVSKLTVDVRQQLTVSPSEGGIDADPLAFGTILNRWSYLRSFEWTAAVAIGAPLGFVRVDPSFNYYDAALGAFAFNALSGVATWFDFYTGDLEYKFIVIGSAFHRGRLMVQYDPGDFGAAGPQMLNLNRNLNFEIDIQQHTATSITIPPSREWPYMRNKSIPFTNPTGQNDYFSSTSFVAQTDPSFGNGSLALMVTQKLSAPLSGGNAGVKVLVFVKPKENFRLGRPNPVLGCVSPLRAESGRLQETFETEASDDVGALSIAPSYRVARTSDSHYLDTFMERPILIGEYVSTPTETFLTFTVDPWTTLLSNTAISNKLNNYYCFAADLEITVVTSASPFYYGLYILFYEPEFTDDFSAKPGAATSTTNDAAMMMCFQQLHALIDITQNKGCELKIPFFYGQDYIQLITGNLASLGRLRLRAVTPLRAVGDVPTQPISLNIYARFTNVRVKGMTAQKIQTLAPQSGSLGTFEERLRINKENGEITTSIDMHFMGETVVSFRPLTKRYSLHKSYEMSGASAAIDTIFYILLPGYPLYRGIQGQVFPGDPGGYNYCSTTWYQLVALMYHGIRGSIRYKIVPGTGQPGVAWQAKWFPADTTWGLIAGIGAGTVPQPASVASVANYSLNSHLGVCVAHSDSNPILQFEVPFQTNYSFTGSRSTFLNENYPYVWINSRGILNPTNDNPLLVYTAAGEDFQAFWYRGLPLMVFSIAFP